MFLMISSGSARGQRLVALDAGVRIRLEGVRVRHEPAGERASVMVADLGLSLVARTDAGTEEGFRELHYSFVGALRRSAAQLAEGFVARRARGALAEVRNHCES